MAKLNGVKTVDMVNGEITKVSYDGVEYTKIAHDFKDAQTGDIFLNYNNGNYYEITIRESDFHGVPHPVRFGGGSGVRDNGYMRGCDLHPLFRKQSAKATPTIEDVSAKVDGLAERVTALEKPAPLKVGDYAKVVVSNTEFNGTYEVGSVVEITKMDESSVPYKAKADGRPSRWFRAEHLKLATEADIVQAEADAIERKRNAIFTENGRKVNEYREGDIVKVVANNSGSENAVGDVGVVTEVSRINVRVEVSGRSNLGNLSVVGDIKPIAFVENRLDRK